MTRRQSLAQLILGAGFASAQTRRELSDKSKVAVAAQNQFGLKLARELAAKRPDENIFISPLSIFQALAMTGNGAAGETKSAMWRTLGLPAGLSDDALNEAAQSLTKLLESENGVQLAIANALWASRSFHFDEKYVKRCLVAYGAKVTTLDFKRAEATETINAWVMQKTMGMIPSIVTRDAVTAAAAILTNAVYFRGKWKKPFAKERTQPKPFHMAGGRMKDVPMMRNENLDIAYRDGIEFESADLAYGGSDIRMQALLPKAGRSAKDVLQKLSWEWLHNVPASADLDLSLPRFTMTFSEMLSPALRQMGMQIAFQPGANFTPMGSPQFQIGEVIHKARIEVDEEGTIAAAATAVAMRVTSAMPVKREKKTLIFDRPFVLLIYENTTGALLFAGLVREP